MKIHVAASAMIGGKMEHNFDALHCRARDAWLAKIGFDKRDAAGFDVVFDVAEAAAGEIVYHVNFRAAFQKLIHEMRTDE